MKKILLILTLLFSVFGWGQYSGTGNFTKVTSLANLTDGYYVITNEEDAFLMTNGRSGSATTGFFTHLAVAPVSGVISNPTTANVWKIETNGGGKTIYNEVISKYVGWSSGNAASVEDAPADTNRWTFSYAGSKFTVLNVAETSRQLSYNSGASRFAAYANAGQQELQFYKYVPSTPCSGTPSPGNTVSSAPSVVSGGTVNLSLQNATAGSGVTYQWQSSTTSASTGFSNISGATSATYTATVTAKTWYKCVVTCSGNSGTSNPVEVNATISYCAAGPTSNSDSEIENVVLAGVNNSISNSTSGVCTGGTGGVVNDFTAQSADLYAGSSYTLTVEFGDCSENFIDYDGAGGVWIDWNNDGDFNDTNEEISKVTLVGLNSGTNQIENFTITVPAAQPVGNYRMRVVQREGGTTSNVSPCGTFSWGSVEDYTVEVIVSSACTGTPNPGNTISSQTSVVSGGTTNLSLQNATTGSGVTYQWQSSTTSASTGFTDISGATSATYTATVNNKTWYRCVVTCSGADGTSAAVAVDVTYAAPSNGLSLKACIANTQVTLSWNAASGTAPTGYIVFAQPNTTIPQMAAASAGNASSYTANSNYSAATTYTTLGKAVFKGNALTTTITGLTNASQYTFKVVAYNGETGTGWANAINNTNTTSSYIQTYTIDVPEVSNVAASINPTTSTVSWNVVPSSAGCYEYMVVANAGAVSLTPTGDGSAYTANTVYAGANSVVYKGTGNSVIVTGLTDATNYCYKVFVREINSGNQWSDGTSVCQTTGVDYCTASGGTNNSMIKNVTFNTINQSSTSTAGYTDYTGVTTTVNIGDIHNLSVTVDSNGNYTSYVIAWIDWNRDGDFNDIGEAYQLGTVTNNSNGISSASPFSITVPTGANIGTTRMRVSANSENSINGYATPCQSFTYGEVEDYTITVVQPANAEINVIGAGNTIPNGADTPFGFNNTLFASTPLNTDSIEKEFTIENIGLANLLLTGSPIIKIEGTNPLDFIVTQQATTPVVNGTNATFKIKFRPTVAGTRTAKVRIESNDSDENPYIFAIEGNGNCTTAPTVAAFPTSGPANTMVTFTSSTSDLTGATITYNNVAVPTVFNSSNTIEVMVPANANDGNFVIQLATGCSKTQLFDVLDTDLTACVTAVGGGSATNLFIYEVYDENGGAGGVVTIYNNTAASVNLSGYSITRAGDYGGTYSTYAILSGTLAANTVALVSVSGSSCGYTIINALNKCG